jgi:hypothetical protein
MKAIVAAILVLVSAAHLLTASDLPPLGVTGVPAGFVPPTRDSKGNYVHPSDVQVQLVSFSETELIMDCSRQNAKWRERYSVVGGKLLLAELTYSSNEEPNDTYHVIVEITPSPVLRSPERKTFPIGMSPIGIDSVDRGWSNFGTYLQKLVQDVQAKWDQTDGKSGTVVRVDFTLNSRGEVSKAAGHAGGQVPRPIIMRSVLAVSAAAPFSPWTPEMQNLLGNEQKITLSFVYP